MHSKRLMPVSFGLKALVISVCLALLGACTSVPVDEREACRAEIDREAKETIDQSNTEKWNGVVGANWDITRRWSVMGEYDGFFGSRDSIFASVGWRF